MMAAECRIKTIVEVSGLGQELGFSTNFTTTAPVLAMYNYDSIPITTAAALDIDGITTVEYIIIKNTDSTNYVELDLAYSAPFKASVKLEAGKTALFKPSGTVWALSYTGACIVEYIVVGTA